MIIFFGFLAIFGWRGFTFLGVRAFGPQTYNQGRPFTKRIERFRDKMAAKRHTETFCSMQASTDAIPNPANRIFIRLRGDAD